jgi:hypothetical protein
MGATFASPTSVFIKNHEASGKMVVDFARNVKDFPVNGYVQVVPVKQVGGYYLEMTVEEAGRILDANLDQFVWYDGEEAPQGAEGTESFEWKPFSCIRRAYPFKLGNLTVENASWDIISQHSSIKSRQAMTARTQLVVNALTTTTNYASSHVIDVTAMDGNTGNWLQSTTARQDIKRSLITAAELIADDTLDVVRAEDLRLVISSSLAGGLSMTQEITDYIKASPHALAQVKGELQGRNTRYGLPDQLYGFELFVEGTRKVTSRKGATRAVSSVFPKTNAALVARPGKLEGVAGAPSFSTVVLFAYEEMTVETKNDSDNRRTIGRVVENITAKMVAPASGVLFQNCQAA